MSRRFDKSKYFTNRPATDLYRMVLEDGLMIKLPSGMTVPLEQIIEREALERAKRIVGEHIELKQEQSEIEKRLRELSMNLVVLNVDDPFPV